MNRANNNGYNCYGCEKQIPTHRTDEYSECDTCGIVKKPPTETCVKCGESPDYNIYYSTIYGSGSCYLGTFLCKCYMCKKLKVEKPSIYCLSCSKINMFKCVCCLSVSCLDCYNFEKKKCILCMNKCEATGKVCETNFREHSNILF
jgi:hypothetical protein